MIQFLKGILKIDKGQKRGKKMYLPYCISDSLSHSVSILNILVMKISEEWWLQSTVIDIIFAIQLNHHDLMFETSHHARILQS